MTQNIRVMFFSMNKKSELDDGGKFHENVETLCLKVGYGQICSN